MGGPRRRPRAEAARRTTGFGQDGQRIDVEHVLAVALQHHHEHLVATLGALDEHRRDDRHRHPEEARPADAVAHVVEADRRVRAEGVVVGAQQRVVLVAAGRDGQRAAEEVRDIGHRRTPGDGLPVHHRQRPVGAGLAEQHVVQPVVAVHEAREPGRRCRSPRYASKPATSRSHTSRCAVRSGRRSARRIRPRAADQRLVHRRLAVEPVGCRHRGVAEQRRVHPAQLGQRQRGLFDCRAADLVADNGGPRIAEQQVKRAVVGCRTAAW